MQTALRTLSQDLPYRLRPEQTTVLEQLGQDRHVFVSLPTGYGKSECLTHWGRVTHTCVSTLTIIGSDNGLSPGRRQAIIETNAGILLIGPLGTNFSEILIGIQTFSFKMHLKMPSAKWRLFGLGLNELTVFPKLMDLLRPYESNFSITWSYLWGGLVRGKKKISLITLSYPKDDAHFVRLA